MTVEDAKLMKRPPIKGVSVRELLEISEKYDAMRMDLENLRTHPYITDYQDLIGDILNGDYERFGK